MSPDPAAPSDFDPEDILWFSYDWCSLPWTDWVPFNADRHTFSTIPNEPGLYRIRPKGKDFLMYIGETGRSLHQRLNELRQNLRRGDLMPWSDPHAEAPALWAWWVEWSSDLEEENRRGSSEPLRREVRLEAELRMRPQVSSNVEGTSSVLTEPSPDPDAPPAEGPEPVMLEISAAPLDASRGGRKAMESFLLYRYRQERNESPLCNFGRFHPRYRKSTTKKENRRGGKLADNQQDNPAGMPSYPPLDVLGKPGDEDWMGLEWSTKKSLSEENLRDVAPGAGVYCISDAGTGEVLYIGQSADCAKSLPDQGRKEWDGHELQFSYQIIGQKVLPHHLRELETDLIGNFFQQNRKAPEYQFR
jgi:hypothetical protein